MTKISAKMTVKCNADCIKNKNGICDSIRDIVIDENGMCKYIHESND